MAKKSAGTKVSEIAPLFKILADENRCSAITFLMRAKVVASVGAIAETLGMSHSSVSHMLAILHDAGIVSYKKKGREVAYSIAKTPRAKRITHLLQRF